ncbi:hypothetical protein [Alteribacter aurantiacus]|uniref:hypothetical protein n=1 Tax=Alteribacter aurantiacus TaxID=254410 RepID=UPI0003F8D39F|nr:hypothetical protein [Alteribacter aurantiacus]
MDFLNWYDFITPTNPMAALFFGFIGTFLATTCIWFSMKERKTSLMAFATGVCVTIAGVFVLYFAGFYS